MTALSGRAFVAHDIAHDPHHEVDKAGVIIAVSADVLR
jgi:hypothetical protein